jgi:hypothetical protein
MRVAYSMLAALLLGLAYCTGGSTAMVASVVKDAVATGRLHAADAKLRAQLLAGNETWWRQHAAPPLREHGGIDAATQLTIAFLASPDPLSDPVVMHGLATADDNAVRSCLAWLTPADTAHSDALMAAAGYSRRVFDMDGTRLGFPIRTYFRLLQARAQPADTAQVVRWLHDPSLVPLRNDLAALLARCGGATVQTELEAYYAQLYVTRHTTPQLRARIRRPPGATTTPYMQDDVIYRENGLWAEAGGPAGAKYALFPAAGLVSDRDLYLALYPAADGSCDELLPTGLTDMCFTHSHPGGAGGPRPRGKLAFSVDGDAVKIMHHKQVVEDSAYSAGKQRWSKRELTGANRVQTTIKLGELRRDKDGDGLTDVLERLLFLDPAQTDSDSDGIIDTQDAAPLANPRRMGPLERGIARALAYSTAIEKNTMWWDTALEPSADTENTAGQPWSARYLLVHGCGPVDYCGGAATYSICLNTPEQHAAYSRALQFYPGMSAVEISWAKRGMDPVQAWQGSKLSDSQPGLTRREAAQWWDYFSQPFMEEPTAALIVGIDYWIHGSTVLLLELDGEYYPYRISSVWVS